jgi:hypothetical protein
MPLTPLGIRRTIKACDASRKWRSVVDPHFRPIL